MARYTRRGVIGTAAAGAAAASAAPAAAHFFQGGVAPVTNVMQAISQVTLNGSTSGGSFIAASGMTQNIGNIGIVLSPATPAASGGTVTLGGSNASLFQLTSNTLPCTLQAPSTTGAGTYSITISYANAAYSGGTVTQTFTITGAVSGGIVNSNILANIATTASPSPTPTRFFQTFPRAAVPSGQIVTPQISGVTAALQADSQIYWDDGSLMGCAWSGTVPSIPGNGGTVQIDFATASGTWSHASTVTIASITGASNFNIQLRNCHTAWADPLTDPTPIRNLSQIALTIGGGVVTGGRVICGGDPTQDTLSTDITGATTQVSGGHATANATIGYTAIIDPYNDHTYDVGGVTVVQPGAGYAFEGTNGTFNASFNDGVANGGQIIQYAKGPYMDAWRVRIAVKDATTNAALTNMLATFYVERYKDASGNFLAFRSLGQLCNSQPSNTAISYTYDLDWRNGATVIRGATNSDPGFTTCLQYLNTNYSTFGPGGAAGNPQGARLDWSVNDAALKAIIVQRDATRIAQFKLCGIVPPIQNITISIPIPTIPTAALVNGGSGTDSGIFEINAPSVEGISTPGGANLISIYEPAGCGVVKTFQPGGEHAALGVLGIHAIAHIIQQNQGKYADAAAWLSFARSQAALYGNAISSMLETSGYICNLVPPAVQSFPGMTPDRSLYDYLDGFVSVQGTINEMTNGAGTGGNGVAFSHQQCQALYMYLIEGEQWMVDQMTITAGAFGSTFTTERNVQVGSQTFWNVYGGSTYDIRDFWWPLRTIGYAAKFNPTTWADGSTNIEQAYLKYVMSNSFTMMQTIIPFVGAIVLGPGTNNYTFTKDQDWTAGGFYDCGIYLIAKDFTYPFMENYGVEVMTMLSYIWRDVSQITSFRSNYVNNYYLQRNGGPNTYSVEFFTISVLEWGKSSMAASDGGPAITNWNSGGNVLNPSSGLYAATGAHGQPIQFQFVAGNPNVETIVYFDPSTQVSIPFIWPGNPGAVNIADGSAFKFTQTAGGGYALSGPLPPPPFTNRVWYYGKNTPTGYMFYTDAAMTNLVTPTQTVSNAYAWFVPNNANPGPTAGFYSDGGPAQEPQEGHGRAQADLACFKLTQAMFGTSAICTACINNFQAIVTDASEDFGSWPLKAFDDTLSS